MKITWIVAVVALLAACGEPKPAAQSAPAADSTQRIQAPAPDRIAPAPDRIAPAPDRIAPAPDRIAPAPEMTMKPARPTAKPKADTTKPAAPVQKADDRLRDSAFGPKFTVDSTGKVRPINKKP